MAYFSKKIKLDNKFRTTLIGAFLVVAIASNVLFGGRVLAITQDLFDDLTKEVVSQDSLADFPVIGERSVNRKMLVLATAYSSDPAQTDSTPCIPAMYTFDLCEYYEDIGINDSIAANFLSLGTNVRLPGVYGDRVIVVRDRMNKKYNGTVRIDIWMPSREEAIQFGAQWIEMEIF